MKNRLILLAACLLLRSIAGAQPAAPADPLVKENATVKVAEHTYVIPDGNVGGVPNVGIIVGNRATLVIDPGLGRRNGEAVLREVAKVSKNSELYIASTHYHPEHTTGYLAFPATAKYVNSTVQEAEFAELGQQIIRTFAGRTPVMGELLKDAQGRKADITFDRDYTIDLGGVRVRMLVVGPTHTRGDTAFRRRRRRAVRRHVVMNNRYSREPDSSVRWAARVRRFEAMKPRTVVPSHGAVARSLIPTQRTICGASSSSA